MTAIAALAGAIVTGALASVPVYGAVDASFVNPQPGTATTTGAGTNVFTWGQSDKPSKLWFTEYNPIDTTVGTTFKLGRLAYYNGSINAGTGADSVDLRIQVDLDLPTDVHVDASYTLDLINTPNSWNWYTSADIVKIPDVALSTPFIYDGYFYSLKLIGFGNVHGDCYLSSNNTKFHVKEGKKAYADLYAQVHRMEAVPEPFTMVLGGLGLAGAAIMRRRRK